MGKSLSRLTLKMGLPYDVQSVGVTLGVVPEIVSLVSSYPALARIVPQCDTSELAALLRAAVADNVPRFVRDGGVIRSGFDAELDEWRDKAAHSSEWLARFEESERERTGIKNLKAGVNKVFGYYIEIPKSSASKAPMGLRAETDARGRRSASSRRSSSVSSTTCSAPRARYSR